MAAGRIRQKRLPSERRADVAVVSQTPGSGEPTKMSHTWEAISGKKTARMPSTMAARLLGLWSIA